MNYSQMRVVLIEIKNISSNDLDEFTEFLRRNMITPVLRSANGHNGEHSYYSGVFTAGQVKRITVWLKKKKIERVELVDRDG